MCRLLDETIAIDRLTGKLPSFRGYKAMCLLIDEAITIDRLTEKVAFAPILWRHGPIDDQEQ
jgi:hypothetical protein